MHECHPSFGALGDSVRVRTIDPLANPYDIQIQSRWTIICHMTDLLMQRRNLVDTQLQPDSARSFAPVFSAVFEASSDHCFYEQLI
jgi:hypothetical protein